MAYNTDVLRVGDSKSGIEIKEPNEKDMSRRTLIISVASLVASIGLLGISFIRSSKLKSIDDYVNPTDVMINRLSKAAKDDVIPLGVEQGDEVSYVHAIIKDPSIIEEYYIRYYLSDYYPLKGRKKSTIDYEEMTIELCSSPEKKANKILPLKLKGGRYWCFFGITPLDKDILFKYHNPDKYEHKTFEQGYGGSVPTNIRKLLNVEVIYESARCNNS